MRNCPEDSPEEAALWEEIADAQGIGPEEEQEIFLSKQELGRSINHILDRGLEREEKNVCPGLFEAFRHLGMRYLYFGMEEGLFLAVLTGFLVLLILGGRADWLVSTPEGDSGEIFYFVFFLSPVMYASFHVISVIKDMWEGMYERKSACFYSLRLLIALRMTFFGTFSLMLSCAGDVLVWIIFGGEEGGMSLFLLLELSFCALLLFGAMQSVILWRFRTPLCHILPAAVWAFFSILMALPKDNGAALLAGVPHAVYLCVITVSILIIAFALRGYIRGSKEESCRYVVYL